MTLFIFFVVVIVALASFGYFTKHVPKTAHLRYKPRLLMTNNELEFFHRIRRATLDGFVFPQVAMAGLIEPDGLHGAAYQASFRRISQKRVDFVVYDALMKLVAVIELDDRTHNPAKDAVRDANFSTAGIRTLRYESRAKPTIAKIRADLASC